MDSKEELKDLIKSIKNATDLGQEAIGLKAGYKAKTLTQVLSSGVNVDAAIRRLKAAFSLELQNIDKNKPKPKVPKVEKDGTGSGTMEKTLADLAAANKMLAEANIIFAEAQRNFSEANKTLADTNKQLTEQSRPVTDSGSKKGTIALATTAALQDILFEKLAPLLDTSKEELHAALRSKISLYQNLALKDHTQNNLSNVGK